MLGFALTLSFAASALFVLAVIAVALHRAVSLARPLKAALEACPQTREVRFRIVETVVVRSGGQVLALPVRQRRVAPAATTGLRAAA